MAKTGWIEGAQREIGRVAVASVVRCALGNGDTALSADVLATIAERETGWSYAEAHETIAAMAKAGTIARDARGWYFTASTTIGGAR